MQKVDEDALRIRVKAELRKRMRGLRNTTPKPACDARSARIVERLLEHPSIRTASKLALFWPIEGKHEVDLRSLDASLRARGAELYYPSIDPDTGAMRMRLCERTGDLVERGFGFGEPPLGAKEADVLDVVVVPAIAVDPRGHRIGYGAGYYDGTLPMYAPPAVTIAVAFDFQLLAEVPNIDTDVAVRYVVTDTRTLAC